MDAARAFELAGHLHPARHACSYYQVDLHVHSPASYDYAGDSAVAPEDFLRTFIERGVDLIAITDHHSGDFIDKAQSAARAISEQSGDNIRVLGGVELDTSEGVHVIAVLPDGCGTSEINDLLSSLGVSPNDRGRSAIIIEKSLVDISEAVHDRGGLIIGAHASSTKGIVEELNGQARLLAIQSMDALELNAQTAELDTKISYVRTALQSAIPFVLGSDTHDCSAGIETMWVKMARCDFRSLTQFLYEPELRISHSRPDDPGHSRIVAVTTTSGIYADVRFHLSPHLNVLIGGRGAGKSALIDLMRFAFEQEPADPATNRRFRDRIAGFLRGGGDVVVRLTAADGNDYLIARAGSFDVSPSRGPEFSSSALVFQLTVAAALPREINLSDLAPVEFYGQGEVASLADRVEDQLRLIDDNLDLTASLEQEEQLVAQLSGSEETIQSIGEQLDERRGEARQRPVLESRLAELSANLADPAFAAREKWSAERKYLDLLTEWASEIQNSIQDHLDAPSVPQIDLAETPSKELLKRVTAMSERARTAFNEKLDELATLDSDLIKALQEARSKWDSAFEVAENAYRAKLVELKIADLDAVAGEARKVKLQISDIETITEPDIAKFEEQLTLLHNDRHATLEQLTLNRQIVHAQRTGIAEELNEALGGSVTIDLSGAGDTTQYRGLLEEALAGSGMQHRVDKIAKISMAITPSSLARVIESKDSNPLEEAGLSTHDVELFLKMDEATRLQLERVPTPALPSIRLKREGEDDYSELGELSVGEKCSAILSVALLNRSKPLVIDQPEDDLDHAFVTESIVESIRVVKRERQVICATHNPNIPVLGDAELIFRVARKPGEGLCEIRVAGGLELPSVTAEVQMLEGGKVAFERRRQRYGDR